jgi:hypothetical protein
LVITVLVFDPLLECKQPWVLADCYECGHCVDLYPPKSTDPPGLVAARKTIYAFVAQLFADSPAPTPADDNSNGMWKTSFIIAASVGGFAVLALLITCVKSKTTASSSDSSYDALASRA